MENHKPVAAPSVPRETSAGQKCGICHKTDSDGDHKRVVVRYEEGDGFHQFSPEPAGLKDVPGPSCELCDKKTHPLMWHRGKLVHHKFGKSGYYPCLRVGGSPARSVDARDAAWIQHIGQFRKALNEAGLHGHYNLFQQFFGEDLESQLAALPGSLPSPAPQPCDRCDECTSKALEHLAVIENADLEEGQSAVFELRKLLPTLDKFIKWEVEDAVAKASGPSQPSEETRATVAHCQECKMEFVTHYGAAAHGAMAKHPIVYRSFEPVTAPSDTGREQPPTDKQRAIDIGNLQFYARMAGEFDWHTDIIHKSVIIQTLSEITERLRACDPQKGQGWPELLTNLRNDGWMVAIHNDYRQDGKPHTFWLFTRIGREGQFVKGEGETDESALLQIVRQLKSHVAAPPSVPAGPQEEKK